MNSKAYKIGFFVLLVVNMASLMLFTFRPKPPMQGDGIRDQISNKLGFSEEQKEVFAGLAQGHREQMMNLRTEEQGMIREYFSHLKLGDKNEQQEALAEKIKEIQEWKLEVTYSHFQEVRSICKEDQIPKFEQLMDDMMQVLIGENSPRAR